MARRKRDSDKLALDASAALAAGMTYGKYMALKYPVTVVKPKPPLKDGEAYCKNCDVVFRKSSHNRVCCSDECTVEFNKRRKREYMRSRRGQ